MLPRQVILVRCQICGCAEGFQFRVPIFERWARYKALRWLVEHDCGTEQIKNDLAILEQADEVWGIRE